MPEIVASLESVSLRYGRKVVLDEVSLELRAGEVVGLIGPGGCGKTQLLKAISTLVHPRSGTVRLFGDAVRWWSRRSLLAARRRVGLQFQNFALFDFLDVRRNVGFTLEHALRLPDAEVALRVDASLAAVGLADAGDRFPSDLSGGMRRRVAIARVMAARPEIALFDDPVAGLDPVNSARIMVLLRTFAADSGALVVVATHDLPRLLPVVRRVVALSGGRVRYDGPAREAAGAADRGVRDFVAAAVEAGP
jgi:phospholipid/cholesterol/gamma-HCH transport system ATP-binding protein